MDYTTVCDFFGGSIFHDDLRGNFVETQQRIDQLISAIDHQSDDEKNASFLLQAVQFVMQGNHKTAQAWLDKIGEVPETSPRWRFRKSSYQILNIAMARSPAIGWPVHLMEFPVNDIWNPKPYPASDVKNAIIASRDLQQHASPVDLFERDLFAYVFGVSHLAFRAHEYQTTTGGGNEVCEALGELNDAKIILEGEQLSFLSLRGRALDLQLTATETFLQRFMLEANKALPSLDKGAFARRLRGLRETCEARHDDLGVAQCVMAIGDSLVSGQHTSPLFLNMQIGDRLDEVTVRTAEALYLEPLLTAGSPCLPDDGGVVESDLEEQLPDIPQHPTLTGSGFPEIASLDQIKEAWKAYSRAESIYQRAGHSRGLGAIKLRRACLLMIVRSNSGVMWANKRYTNDLERHITELLREAAQLFSSNADIIHEKLVQVHLLILEQLSTESAEQARETGASAEDNDATMLQWYLATFAQRLGDYYRYFCGSSLGMHCYEIARLLCIRAPTLNFTWLQSLDSLTEFSLAFGFSQVAKASIATMQESLDNILGRLRATQRVNADDVGVCRCCKNLRWYLVHRLVRRVLSTYTTMGLFTKEVANSVKTLLEKLDDIPEDLFTTIDLDTKDLVEIYAERARCSHLMEDGNHSSFDEVAQNMVESYTRRSSFDVLEACSKFMADISEDSISMQQFGEKFGRLEHRQLSAFHERETFSQLNGASKEEMEAVNSVTEIFLVERAMGTCIFLKRWDQADQLMEMLTSKLAGYATSVYCPTISLPWQRRLWAGLVAEHKGRYYDALRLYFQSWYFATVKRMDDMDLEQKRFQMTFSDRARIYSCIARLCVYVRTQRFSLPEPTSTTDQDLSLLSATSSANIPPESADETAIEWLELGKARNTMALLALWKNDPPGSNLSKWLELNRRMALWTELQSRGAMRTQDEEAEFLQLDQEAVEMERFLIENIGVLPSQRADASLWYKFPTLCASIPDDTLVIYTAISQDGLALFAIDNTGILHRSWNPSVRPFQIRKAVSTYLGLMNQYQCGADINVLNFLSAYLSSIFIQPLARFVLQKEVIFFVPSGDMARFPLNTLMLDGRYLFPWKKVCQVPSLSLYHHARSTATLDGEFAASAIARPGSLREELDGGLAALPMGAIEALHASLVCRASIFDATTVTRDRFRELLQTSSILHISTHGKVNYERPGHSWIALQQPFRILDLANVRAKVSAVVFSACFSGAGMAHSSGDVVGFSHAVLATGTKAYVGALWKVKEVSTLIQMFLFYIRMVRQSDEIFLFRDAWHEANETVLSLDLPRAVEFLRSMAAEWDIMERKGLNPNGFVKGGREAVTESIEELGFDGADILTEFQHPFIWAAFNVVGFADWGIRNNINRYSQPAGEP
ncbi:CHAT domain-containing protein [Ilyonectria robusta]|uniref:CHAT domain-containing protein n=1 Tax=Ilyonectria robusta TaxID=1079257 RepID=UPI001E8D7675|nr:CHAT domain-containing protein [Ilyonectria robusta]KAH8733607.1 CHAT domain-containing protein [Ilyonectria robusta]